MSQITVNPQQLMNKATELRNQNSSLKSQIENLRSNEGALAAMWEGEAKQAFRNAFNQDISRMEAFYSTVEQYAVALENIAAEYMKAESKNVSIVSSGRI
ncbi:MAG: WXG100 family type VII secretion target [Mogibacterium sp.]|nr:WXG100 family type VII secretion target [Mogibacterium sp.]